MSLVSSVCQPVCDSSRVVVLSFHSVLHSSLLYHIYAVVPLSLVTFVPLFVTQSALIRKVQRCTSVTSAKSNVLKHTQMPSKTICLLSASVSPPRATLLQSEATGCAFMQSLVSLTIPFPSSLRQHNLEIISMFWLLFACRDHANKLVAHPDDKMMVCILLCVLFGSMPESFKVELR